MLNPLDSPHHMRTDDESEYREGVVLDRPTKQGQGSLVNCGMRQVRVIWRLKSVRFRHHHQWRYIRFHNGKLYFFSSWEIILLQWGTKIEWEWNFLRLSICWSGLCKSAPTGCSDWQKAAVWSSSDSSAESDPQPRYLCIIYTQTVYTLLTVLRSIMTFHNSWLPPSVCLSIIRREQTP